MEISVFERKPQRGGDTGMYLTNYSPRALIGALSVTTEAGMKDQQTLDIRASMVAGRLRYTPDFSFNVKTASTFWLN